MMKNRFSRVITIALIMAICFPLLLNIDYGHAAPDLQSPESDWPMYQHDAQHSGRTTATVPTDGPLHLQWAYAFGERVEVEVQPIVSQGVAYIGAMNGEMHAIDAASGTRLWVTRPGGPIPHSAAVDGQRVYFGSLDGDVYALSVNDGGVAWSYRTGGPVMSAPAVVDGRVFIGSNDGYLYALDASSGSRLWRVKTGGPVVSSPAVFNGRVYFGSEDLKARCIEAASGSLIWEKQLRGAGMRNTHPVVSDDGQVVIFQTVKAGGSTYVHVEGYPNAAQSANPSSTWNTYYQHHPERRHLYYLDGDSGNDLWDSGTRRYVPLPIPYWGLVPPILGPDGMAWFPVPAGTEGSERALDHDNRLIKVDLNTGVASQVAGGSQAEFQMRPDEVGRHVFAGGEYFYTISEDLAVFRPSTGYLRALFSNGDPTGYNFGSHMDPHSPLPSRHLWRYGGSIAMGGVPGASPPIVANDKIFFTSYGWLYAVGGTNHGYDPATSFPARDARRYELTYLRESSPSLNEIRSEIEVRVDTILNLGVGNYPLAVRWEQADDRMMENEFTFELYGYEAELVRILSEAYPYLTNPQKDQLGTYLSALVSNTLLDPNRYTATKRCYRYGDGALLSGNACDSDLVSRWFDNNENIIGMRLYALMVYAKSTNDWGSIQAGWPLITQQFQKFLNSYAPSLGFCDFPEWRTGRLNIAAQIAAAQAVRDMAAILGYTSIESQAATLLANLLNGRIALANFVPNLYDTGALQPARIRLNPDGTIVNQDIMGPSSPYNSELIPYDAALRDRNTDPSQVNWWDGQSYRLDAGIGFMNYAALSGHFPFSSELAARLRADALAHTRNYVKSYEVNNPWWWMSDLAHSTTCGGEHLYHSPTLAWTLFQVKAWVLQEEWNTLARQLPEPAAINSRYDLYRLQNLVTLLSIAEPAPTSTFVDVPPDHWAYEPIETLYQAGYIAGCSTTPMMYCPERILTRAESSVFILRGVYGAIADPPHTPPESPSFQDVTPDSWEYGWVESLYQDGFTTGCSADPPLFCPLQENTRAEGSVFFLRIKYGADYQPTLAVGLFSDVESGAWYADWVEAAYLDGLLLACGTDPLRICPEDPLDRAWAADIMVKAKGLSAP